MAYIDPYQEQIMGMEQQRRTAQQMQQQAMSPLQGQMVSGRYVAPSWTQQLARGLRGGLGAYQESQAREGITKTQAERNKALAEAMRGGKVTDIAQISPEMAGVVSREQNPDLVQITGPDGQPTYATRQQALGQQAYQAGMGADQQRGQIVYGADGNVYNVNPYTSQVTPVTVDGKQLSGAQYSAGLQSELAGAKASGTTAGKAQTEAAIELPQVESQANESIRLVDELLQHPGMSTAVGFGSSVAQFAPSGTPTRDFLNRLDQIKGKQFMQAFQSLRGGGQITEAEGKKAEQAISRMNTSSSEAEFKKAAEEFKDILRGAVSQARQKAGARPQAPAQQSVPTQQTGGDRPPLSAFVR